MESTFRFNHKRAVSQLKSTTLNHEDYLSIQKFKPIEYNSKLAINIQMPKIKLEDRVQEKSKYRSESPLKNLVKIIKQPVHILEETLTSNKHSKNLIYDIKKPKDFMKIIVFPEKQKTPAKNVEIKSDLARFSRIKLPKLDNTRKPHGIYFELLGFFIKKHLDYNPYYKKIDTENKGFIDKYDIKNYFYLTSCNSNVEQASQNFLFLGQVVSKDPVIYKRTFFGLCSAIEYDFPFSYRLFAPENSEKLHTRLNKLKQIFHLFTPGQTISINYLNSICKEVESSGSLKALEMISAEEIDFSRFLVCLPFFMWLQAANNMYIDSD